jgi:hypothetical protein
MEPIKINLVKFDREKAKMPTPPQQQSASAPFNWLFSNPQHHSIEPFAKLESSRKENTDRK